MRKYFFAALRFACGLLYASSGFRKLIEPMEFCELPLNYYGAFPAHANHLLAMGLPWIELILGVFVLLGLRLKKSIPLLLILIAFQEAILGYAAFWRRGYRVNGLISGPLAGLGTKAGLLACVCIGVILLLVNNEKERAWTLDRFLDKHRV